MLPYKTLINLDRTAATPIYVQICNAFITLIKNRTLQPGNVLPSTRKLSGLISVNRNTASLAYDELISQGWAESISRKGIFVLTLQPSPSKAFSAPFHQKQVESEPAFSWSNRFDAVCNTSNFQKRELVIDHGIPDVRLAPIDQLMTEYRSISKRYQGKNFLKYGNPKGSENLRMALGNFLSTTRGIANSPENILITKGSQMGIYLAAQLLIAPGDIVVVGTLNYTAADATFRICGAKLVQVIIDENGIDTDHLEQILQRQKIKAIYVMPQHHCPTTVTMSMARRHKLLELAKEYSFAIIEDDFDSDFHYEDHYHLPLLSMDQNQNVVYIGSFSKTLAPAFRLGFLVGPAKFVDAAANLRKYIDMHGDTLMEEALASLFNTGEIERHFRKTLKIYKERRDLCCDILLEKFKDIIEFDMPQGGLAIWSRFDKSIDTTKMSQLASSRGLYIPAENFYENKRSSANGLRMGFASLAQHEMTQAFETLKKSIA